MDGWMDGRLDGWESNGTSLWKKESLIDLSSRQVSERTPRPFLLPATASPGGGSAGCLLPAPAFKSLAGDTNVSPVDLPARVGTKVRLTTAHLVGALGESRKPLGLWDVAGAARLQRVGHCYTLQPWGIGMGED